MDGSDNQIFFLTADAQKTFGGLIREWTKDPQSRPKGTQDNGRTVIQRADFVAFLAARNLVEGHDYLLRGGENEVKEVQIVSRRPEQLLLVLPEADLLQKVEAEANPHIHLSRTHREAEDQYPVALKDQQPQPSDGGRAAMIGAEIGQGDFDVFLDEYLGDYVPRQCL